MNNKGITPTQMMKLKELNSKLYTGIAGSDRDGLIENFDMFLNQYSKHIQFFEELNYFRNSVKERFYMKQMEVKVGRQPNNQVEAVKAFLESGRTITALQAIEFFGCMRLAAVIHTLRKEHQMNIIDVSDRRYSEYKLIIE